MIELPTNAWNPDQAGENFQFWRQMQLAGLLEGTITGFTPPLGGGNRQQPAYSPASKSNGAYWSMFSDFTWVGGGNFPPGTDGTNSFMLNGSGVFRGSVSQPEMWNIDTKIDDGIPTSGAIVSSVQAWGGPTACVYGNTYPTDGVYNVAVNEAGKCTFVARKQF